MKRGSVSDECSGFDSILTRFRINPLNINNILAEFDVGLVILDEQGIIRFVAPSVKTLLRYEPRELIGKSVFHLLQGVSFEQARKKFAAFLSHRQLTAEGMLQLHDSEGNSLSFKVVAYHVGDYFPETAIVVQYKPAPAGTHIMNGNISLKRGGFGHNVKLEESMFNKIAAELHDHLNPSLAAAKLMVEHVAETSGNRSDVLLQSSKILSNIMSYIRGLSNSLSLGRLENFSLVQELNSLVGGFRLMRDFRITIKVSAVIDNLLAPEVKLHLFRIIQEQLNNIVRHSAADKALISVGVSKGRVVLNARDNGKGFDVNKKVSGIGLSNMYLRTAELGGNMHISSRLGAGTWIHIHFPLALRAIE